MKSVYCNTQTMQDVKERLQVTSGGYLRCKSYRAFLWIMFAWYIQWLLVKKRAIFRPVWMSAESKMDLVAKFFKMKELFPDTFQNTMSNIKPLSHLAEHGRSLDSEEKAVYCQDMLPSFLGLYAKQVLGLEWDIAGTYEVFKVRKIFVRAIIEPS